MPRGRGSEAQRREAAMRSETTRPPKRDRRSREREEGARPVERRAQRGRETRAGGGLEAGCKKKGEPTPGGADSPKRREGGRSTQKGMSSSKSSVDVGAPPAGMAPPFAGSVAGAAAGREPLPLAPFGLSRNCTL